MRRVPFLLLIVLCVFMAGCGPSVGGSYTVTGRITKADDPGQGLEGVTIFFSGGDGIATTDANGNWSKSGLSGAITITPAKDWWRFDPINRQVNKAASNVDFSASTTVSTYMISGRVTHEGSGQGVAGVTISFSDDSGPATTDANGNWSKSGLSGIIAVTPAKDGWAFDPINRHVNKAASNVDFTAYPPTSIYTAFGQVTCQDNGQGLKGVTITFSDGSGSVDTEAGGIWRKSGLKSMITVTPVKAGWAFSPASKQVTPAASHADFIARIAFEDSNLEAVIREKIGKPTGQLTITDVTYITELDGGRRSISQLGGMQHLISLQLLFLPENQIYDISPMAGLANLTFLDMDKNQIYDIRPLAGSIYLRNLYLDQNQISDISPLARLTYMNQLYLSRNLISDISPLAGLTDLDVLDLSNNLITDISALVANTGLGNWDFIDLSYNLLDMSYDSDDMRNINLLMGRGVEVNYWPQR